MISAQSIAALEQRKLEYVLGVRERSSAEVRSTVISQEQDGDLARLVHRDAFGSVSGSA
jgi:hypothetical protein